MRTMPVIRRSGISSATTTDSTTNDGSSSGSGSGSGSGSSDGCLRHETVVAGGGGMQIDSGSGSGHDSGSSSGHDQGRFRCRGHQSSGYVYDEGEAQDFEQPMVVSVRDAFVVRACVCVRVCACVDCC